MAPVHVLPVRNQSAHNETDQADCFCGAVGYVLCAECGHHEKPGCWRCGTGMTRGMVPAHPGDRPDVIIHEDR